MLELGVEGAFIGIVCIVAVRVLEWTLDEWDLWKLRKARQSNRQP
jgi:hypothetical protein